MEKKRGATGVKKTMKEKRGAREVKKTMKKKRGGARGVKGEKGIYMYVYIYMYIYVCMWKPERRNKNHEGKRGDRRQGSGVGGDS